VGSNVGTLVEPKLISEAMYVAAIVNGSFKDVKLIAGMISRDQMLATIFNP
jgi:hypothetical protein